MARSQELLLGISLGKQADITTAETASIIRVNKLDADPYNFSPTNEDDADETGKGHEFATEIFKSHIAPNPSPIRKYLSSEWAAFCFCYALGHVSKAGSGPYTYTVVPLNTAVDEDELPYFSYCEQMRPGGSAVLDRLFVGVAIKSLRMQLQNVPGRQAMQLTAEILATGQLTQPSAVTLPAPTTLHELNIGSMTISMNGISNYVTAHLFESLDFSIDNNFIPGFFPGSGSQSGYQIQGRMQVGKRVISMSYEARFRNGSTELTKLLALTTGTAQLVIPLDSNNNLQLDFYQVSFKTAEIGNKDGIVTVRVTCSMQYDATNGVMTATIKTPLNGICQ
jgi:hypothetical protein